MGTALQMKDENRLTSDVKVSSRKIPRLGASLVGPNTELLNYLKKKVEELFQAARI